MEAVLDDYESAPIDGRMREVLRFLEKMTLRPDELSGDDARKARAAGLSDMAIEEAARIAFAFNLIDRLADSFVFEVPSPAAFAKGAPGMLKRGYNM